MNIRRFVITALKRFRQTYDESIPTGLPTGGAAGQALVKKSAADGDVQWAARASVFNESGSDLVTVTDGGANRISLTPISGGKTRLLVSGENIGDADPDDQDYLVSDVYVDGLVDAVSARVSMLEGAGYQTAQNVDDKIATALQTFDKLDYKVVDSAPTPTTVVIDGKTEPTRTGVRYMVKHTTDDRYQEYILIDGKIYDIGSTGEIDMSAYATTAAMNTALAAKQDTLVSGTNIKRLENIDLIGGGTINVRTVNNESVLGTGNINTAKILYDTTDQTTVLSDTGSDVQIGINRVDDNTLNINETAPDTRGQSQTVYNMNLPTKGYVDEVKGTHFEVGTEKWQGTYTEDGVTYQVYSKIIKIDALPATAGITNYPHGIVGIKQILSAYGFTTDGFVLNAPRQNAQDNISIYQISKSATTGSVAIEVGKDRSSKKAFVCLVYAKND